MTDNSAKHGKIGGRTIKDSQNELKTKSNLIISPTAFAYLVCNHIVPAVSKLLRDMM